MQQTCRSGNASLIPKAAPIDQPSAEPMVLPMLLFSPLPQRNHLNTESFADPNSFTRTASLSSPSFSSNPKLSQLIGALSPLRRSNCIRDSFNFSVKAL